MVCGREHKMHISYRAEPPEEDTRVETVRALRLCQRRVAFNPNHGTGVVTISGNDNISRRLEAEIFPVRVDLPIVELDLEEKENWADAADAACQILIDEQEN